MASLLWAVTTFSAHSSVEPMDDNLLNFYFSSICKQDGMLVLKRNRGDLSFRVQVGNAPATDCPPGSVVKIPLRTPCRIFNHQSELEFLPGSWTLIDKGFREPWLVEEKNRKGDVQVAMVRFHPWSSGEVRDERSDIDVVSIKITDLTSLMELEKGCTHCLPNLPKAETP